MRIAAEAITGNLIVGALGLHKRDRGFKAYLLSMELLCTLIQSPGYHADQGVVGFVWMFVVLMVVALIALSFAGEFGAAERGLRPGLASLDCRLSELID